MADQIEDELADKPAVDRLQEAAEGISRGRSDEEDIRLFTGFTDIFSAIVLVGLLVATAALGAMAAPFLGGLIVAAASFFLTRYFVVKRHFAACGIVLAIAFGVGVSTTFSPLISFFAPLIASGALWFYWKTYKVPISAALALAFATIGPAMLYFRIATPFGIFNGGGIFNFIILSIGLVLFAVAIYWDISDRDRTTRRSDVAFWLHLVAGPLLVHGTFSSLGLSHLFDMGAANNTVTVWPIFVLVALFAATAVVVDRRPLILASFSYLVFAIGMLAYRQFVLGSTANEGNIPLVLMIATMVAGICITVLAGTWGQLRGVLLAVLPAQISGRLAPLQEWRLPDASTQNVPDGEKEPLRLVHGLNDYMAAVGMGTLFIGSLFAGYVLAQQLISPLLVLNGGREVSPVVSYLASYRIWVALAVPIAVIGVLAAFFVRRRRMALTGVAAALQFALLSAGAVYLLTIQFNLAYFTGFQSPTQAATPNLLPVVFGCVLAAGANAGFGRFNRIPASYALALLMLFPLLFLDYILNPAMTGISPVEAAMPQRAIVFGIIAFAVAMGLDRQDPGRQTQRSDKAFWMHLLAALFFIPAAYKLLGTTFGDAASVKLLFFAALVMLAVVTDRRAMLLVALPVLVGQHDGGAGLIWSVGIFAFLTVLNLNWAQARQVMLSRFMRRDEVGASA